MIRDKRPGVCKMLETPIGRIALLQGAILAGVIANAYNVALAEHVAIAALAVVLVELNRQDMGLQNGQRLAALVILFMIGAAGMVLSLRVGEQIILSTAAVFFVVIRDQPFPKTP